jgi:cell division protein FtsN
MPSQDYVSRTPKKKNNARTKRTGKASSAKKSKSNKRSNENNTALALKTKLVTAIVIVLVSAFAYGLWALKTAPSTKTPVPLPSPTQAEQNQPKTLPEPPKEKWSYVKDLENKQIEVGEYEVKDKGPYQMQCGSFRTQKQAEVLKANIAFSGISSKIKTVEGKNGTWFKVVLGPYARKRLAEKDKHTLKRNNVNYCQIWLWR